MTICGELEFQKTSISIAEALRLRAINAVTHDKSVRRSAQDDDFVVSWSFKSVSNLGIYVYAITFLPGERGQDASVSQDLRERVLWAW